MGSALSKAIEYISFNAGNFASGYQNIVLERPLKRTLLEWGTLWDYLNTTGFIWEMGILVLGAALCLLIYFTKENKLTLEKILALCITVYGLVLARSALGRSDIYHLYTYG